MKEHGVKDDQVKHLLNQTYLLNQALELKAQLGKVCEATNNVSFLSNISFYNPKARAAEKNFACLQF